MDVVKDFVGQPTPLLHAVKNTTLQHKITKKDFIGRCMAKIIFLILYLDTERLFRNEIKRYLFIKAKLECLFGFYNSSRYS